MFLYALGASLVGSVLALLGGFLLLWKENFAKAISLSLVSFAAGSLLGAAFLDLLPESLEAVPYESAATLVVVGIVTVFLFEKLLRFYHVHEEKHETAANTRLIVAPIIFGDALHNFLDGVVIALSFAADFRIGLITTLAVFFHEIPQEIGDFGVMLHAGYKRSKIILYNFLAALATPLGAIIGYLLSGAIEVYIPLLLAFVAGTFIYISVSDLLPELRHKNDWKDIFHVLLIVLGVFAIWALSAYIPE